MPPTPLTYRPQTLKQAKKAYRKSGATVRLSESEKAVLERRAVLQERADRIKEREARRKANLKRKEERVQREREARHRMGIPTPPPKEGIQVGPSQSHLSEFMYAGVKRKGENEVEEEKKFDIQKQGRLVVQEQQERAMGPPMSRQPLQTSCANASPLWMIPSQMVNGSSPEVRDFVLQENQPPPKRTSLARNPLQAKSANPMIQQKPLAEDKDISGLQTKAAYLQRPQASPMDQPPLRPPVQATITKSTSFKKPPLIPLPSKPEAIPENYFDEFFVSNTQIQRELSPPPTPPTRTTPDAVSIARSPTPLPPPRALEPAAAEEDAADLLAFISTQDLDFSGELTQIAPPAPQEEPHDETEADDEDFPDDELEDIVLEFELESSVKSSNATTPNDQPPQPDLLTQSDGGGSHYDSDDADDAELQAGLHMVFRDYEKERQCQEAQRAAECDAFDLSTQDLRELES